MPISEVSCYSNLIYPVFLTACYIKYHERNVNIKHLNCESVFVLQILALCILRPFYWVIINLKLLYLSDKWKFYSFEVIPFISRNVF